MGGPPRTLTAVACLLAIACAVGQPTPPAVDATAGDSIGVLDLDGWRRADVAGLSVYTNAADDEVGRVLRRTEQFVAFLGDFLGDFRLDGDTTAPRPTDVFVFARDEQLQLFTPEPGENGFGVLAYVAESLPKLSLASSVRSAAPELEIFQHELVHVIHTSDPDRRFPPWVMEGLASYFATVSFRSDVLTLGRPSDTWMAIVRSYDEALPLARVFSWDRAETLEPVRLYADSWAFAHYGLQSEAFGGPPRVGAFRAFVDRVGRGQAWLPALEAAFDAPLAVVEAEFQDHRRRLRAAEVYRLAHLRVPLGTGTPAFVAVVATEIARRLAELATSVGEWGRDARRRLYDHLLESGPEDPDALVGRARVAIDDGDLELAQRLWEWVPPESRDGFEALLAQAELAQARWVAEPADARDRDGFNAARDAWTRVLAAAPDHLPALVSLGTLHGEAAKEDPRIGVDALRRAAEIDPHRRSIRVALARLLARAGDVEAARRELDPIAALDGDTETAREARRLLRELH